MSELLQPIGDYMEQKYDSPDFGAGDALLESLLEFGLITESASSLINSISMIAEASQNTPTLYVYNGHYVYWDLFKKVYTDFDTYPDYMDVFKALGYPPTRFDKKDSARIALTRIAAFFIENNKEARDLIILPVKERKQYSKWAAERVTVSASRERPVEGGRDDDWLYADRQPTKDDIDPGRKGRATRATRTIDRINSQELLTGEFYSDFSRIPPSRWGSWLRFWDKEKSSVKQTKNLIGRSWKKTFVLGYQVENNLVYEVWYNSLDSSFSLHDYRGSQLSRAFPTLSEATKAMVNAIAQMSSKDAAFFASGMSNQIATSMFRSMTSELDTRIDDLRRLEDKEQKDAAEAERKRAEENEKRKRLGNLEYFRQKMKETGMSQDIQTAKKIAAKVSDVAQSGLLSDDQYEKLKKMVVNGALDKAIEDNREDGRRAIQAALTAAKTGKIPLSRLADRVGEVFGVVGTQNERKLRDALIAGDISMLDYVDAMRDLATRMNKPSRFADTPLKPQPAGGERKQKPADMTKAWKSGEGEFIPRAGKIPQQDGVGYQVKAVASDAVRKYVEDSERRADALRRELAGENDLPAPVKKPVTPKKKPPVTFKSLADQFEKKTKKKKEVSPAQTSLTFESLLDDLEKMEAQESAISSEVDSSHMSMVRGMRKEAMSGQFTQDALKKSVNSELLNTYTQSRVDVNFPKGLLTGWINRGRKEPIVLPTNKPSLYDRAKMFINGHRYHADFIVGFSLKDMINVEVWYIVEPNPEYSFSLLANNGNLSPTVSSFYVFDVTSGKLLRKFVPYYRNAVQIAMAKLSAQ